MDLKKGLLILGALLGLCPAALAESNSGWSVSSVGIWRLKPDADYFFTSGTPAKILEIDRLILNRQAKYTRRQGLVNTYTFKVGCLYQSKTPVFELQTQPLDIRITDQFNGYAFARFLVDHGQEYALRGEFLPPARLVFAPLTQSQNKRLSDLFLQLREGADLYIAILEGPNSNPRVFNVPLEGFIALSDAVLSDCTKLNEQAGSSRGEVKFLPDYVTKEPEGYAPRHYTLKPKPGTDGLTVVELQQQPDDSAKDTGSEEQKPETKLFEPGGGVASIGEDGKPIRAEDQSADLGTAAGPMSIGEDGVPVASGDQESPADAAGESGSATPQTENTP